MNSNCLKIISLNIEQDNHFERIVPFLKEQKPDIILFQEIFEKDLSYFEHEMGMSSIFTGLNYMYQGDKLLQLGIATFSALPRINHNIAYYRHSAESLPTIKQGEPEKMARAILVTEFTKDAEKYCLVNTHFTWSPNGCPNNQQILDLEILFKLLEKIPHFLLCGDFNAPRGTAIFDAIAQKYKDNIPNYISTTIDKNLHCAGDLNLVVDGLFTTSQYHVDSVEIVNELSDHCAIVAQIKNKII